MERNRKEISFVWYEHSKTNISYIHSLRMLCRERFSQFSTHTGRRRPKRTCSSSMYFRLSVCVFGEKIFMYRNCMIELNGFAICDTVVILLLNSNSNFECWHIGCLHCDILLDTFNGKFSQIQRTARARSNPTKPIDNMHMLPSYRNILAYSASLAATLSTATCTNENPSNPFSDRKRMLYGSGAFEFSMENSVEFTSLNFFFVSLENSIVLNVIAASNSKNKWINHSNFDRLAIELGSVRDADALDSMCANEEKSIFGKCFNWYSSRFIFHSYRKAPLRS